MDTFAAVLSQELSNQTTHLLRKPVAGHFHPMLNDAQDMYMQMHDGLNKDFMRMRLHLFNMLLL